MASLENCIVHEGKNESEKAIMSSYYHENALTSKMLPEHTSRKMDLKINEKQN